MRNNYERERLIGPAEYEKPPAETQAEPRDNGFAQSSPLTKIQWVMIRDYYGTQSRTLGAAIAKAHEKKRYVEPTFERQFHDYLMIFRHAKSEAAKLGATDATSVEGEKP